MASTSKQQPRVGEQRPGGRAARVREDVLRAAADVLDEVGYDELSYESVAERAGVHRTTVYRRWPAKHELVAEAVGLHSDEHVPIPDTGTLHGDLAALAASVADNITSVGGARRSRSIIAAAASSEQLGEAVTALMSRRVELAEAIVANAVARDEVTTGCDPTVIVESVVAPIWFRLLLTGEPIDDEFLTAVVDLVVRGVT